MYRNYIHSIRQKIQKISSTEGILLGAYLLEPYAKLYDVFSQTYNFGNFDFILGVINLCKSPNDIDIQDIVLLEEKMEMIIPDLDDFDGKVLVSYAFDFSTGLDELLEYIITKNNDKLVGVFESIYNSIDLYVSISEKIDPNNKNIDAMVLNHEIMKLELKRQEDFFACTLQNLSINDLKTKFGIINNGYEHRLSIPPET